MASIRQKLTRLTSSGPSEADAAKDFDQYKLLVTAGPSYDQSQHQAVRVNSGVATTVENEFIKAKIKVRVRSFRGLPSKSPEVSPYFNVHPHEKDQYSIAFSFVPKQDLPSLDTVWGNTFDHPIRERLPPGFNTAIRIVKDFIDPGLSCDAYADEPYLYGPSLSCWFVFRICNTINLEAGEGFPDPAEDTAMQEGAEGSGTHIRQSLGLPETGDKRRKFFLSAQNRETFTFEKGRLYQGDFYNPYLDFAHMALKLPGFNMKVWKYVDQKSHCLRYVFKNRKTGEVYFNINFHLLYGEQKQEAVKKDEEQRSQEDAGREVNGYHLASVMTPNGDATHAGAEAQAGAQHQVNHISDLLKKSSLSDRQGSRPHVMDNDDDVD